MNDEKNEPESKPNEEPGKPQCSCVTDPFASLPPDLRPRPKNVMGGLRNVKCPGCGLIYWTNRDTDLCMQCEKKGARPKEANTETGA